VNNNYSVVCTNIATQSSTSNLQISTRSTSSATAIGPTATNGCYFIAVGGAASPALDGIEFGEGLLPQGMSAIELIRMALDRQ
jgi:hypothetical protein